MDGDCNSTPALGGVVTVVTVTYGRRWHLLKEAVASALREGAARVVIVDNGAQEDISNLASAAYGNAVDVLKMGRNTGSAGGFKAGMARVLELGTDFVMLLDDDNQLQPGCLVRLSDSYRKWAEQVPEESLAVLAFRSDRQADVAARVPASGMSANNAAFFGFNFVDVPFKLFRRTPAGRRWISRKSPVGEVTVAIAPYSGLYFHRTALQAHGLPNENFLLYADDTDFSYRFTKSGGKIVLVTQAQLVDMELSWNVKARFSNTLDALLLGDGDFRAYYSTRNNAYFEKYSRGGAKVARAINRGMYLFALFLRAKMIGRSGRFRLLLQAVRDGEAGRLGESPMFPLA